MRNDRPPNLEQAADQAGRPAIFTAQGLSKSYQMGELKVKALVDVNLTIDSGGFMVLLGPSGSGIDHFANP